MHRQGSRELVARELTQGERGTWATRSPLAFGAAMVGLMFGLKVLTIPLILAAGGADTTGPVLDRGLWLVFVAFAILPVETCLGQWLPIWLLGKLGVRTWFALCAWSGAFFGVLHLGSGLGGWAVGFTSGAVLSHCWLSWRAKSLGTAFWFTTAVHAVHNALAFLLYIASR